MGKDKLILRNKSSYKDLDLFDYFKHVVDQGRISGANNESYCYGTTYNMPDGGSIMIYARRNRASDTLAAVDYGGNDGK